MTYWRDLFSPRQLLGHGTSVEVFRELLVEAERQRGALSEVTTAAFVYLALALDKLRDYNSRMTRELERPIAKSMVNTFDRHDFAFKWSYAEMAPLIAGLGYDWAIEQTAQVHRGAGRTGPARHGREPTNSLFDRRRCRRFHAAADHDHLQVWRQPRPSRRRSSSTWS